jgi:hypothetical protein
LDLIPRYRWIWYHPANDWPRYYPVFVIKNEIPSVVAAGPVLAKYSFQ